MVNSILLFGLSLWSSSSYNFTLRFPLIYNTYIDLLSFGHNLGESYHHHLSRWIYCKQRIDLFQLCKYTTNHIWQILFANIDCMRVRQTQPAFLHNVYKLQANFHPQGNVFINNSPSFPTSKDSTRHIKIPIPIQVFLMDPFYQNVRKFIDLTSLTNKSIVGYNLNWEKMVWFLAHLIQWY